jgi:hypothetical protein
VTNYSANHWRSLNALTSWKGEQQVQEMHFERSEGECPCPPVSTSCLCLLLVSLLEDVMFPAAQAVNANTIGEESTVKDAHCMEDEQSQPQRPVVTSSMIFHAICRVQRTPSPCLI